MRRVATLPTNNLVVFQQNILWPETLPIDHQKLQLWASYIALHTIPDDF